MNNGYRHTNALLHVILTLGALVMLIGLFLIAMPLPVLIIETIVNAAGFPTKGVPLPYWFPWMYLALHIPILIGILTIVYRSANKLVGYIFTIEIDQNSFQVWRSTNISLGHSGTTARLFIKYAIDEIDKVIIHYPNRLHVFPKVAILGNDGSIGSVKLLGMFPTSIKKIIHHLERKGVRVQIEYSKKRGSAH
jgi:hypothetical protein